MKKLTVLLLAIIMAGCTTQTPAPNTPTPEMQESLTSGNYTDEMKIDYLGKDLDSEYGADSVERQGDHQDSPYFNRLDFYNMQSTESLTLLPHFKTMQQTSEWSCGVTSALMVMEYFGTLGDLREEDLAAYRSNGLTPGATSLSQAIDIFEGIGGYELESSYDYAAEELGEVFPMERFETLLAEGTPVMVCWNDWGGHWQVVIGYDNMGTETTQDDVLIVADPYDTTDHNQDGYGVYGAERFYYNWSMYDFFEDSEDAAERDLLFLIAKPIAQ